MATKAMQDRYSSDDYGDAVKAVATKLRKRFASGSLRGWRDEDEDATTVPFETLEETVAREWIADPVRALAVLDFSLHGPSLGAGWSWDGFQGSLLGAAKSAMAHDVLAYACAQGWYMPAEGEEGAEELLREAAEIRRAA